MDYPALILKFTNFLAIVLKIFVIEITSKTLLLLLRPSSDPKLKIFIVYKFDLCILWAIKRPIFHELLKLRMYHQIIHIQQSLKYWYWTLFSLKVQYLSKLNYLNFTLKSWTIQAVQINYSWKGYTIVFILKSIAIKAAF